MQIKKCTRCGLEKPINNFPKVGCKCKRCKAELLRIYRNNHPELKLLRREYIKRNREKIIQQKKESYRRNVDKIKSKNNDYYHEHVDYCRLRQREYQKRIETQSVESWLMKCMKHAKTADKKLSRNFDLTLDFLMDLYHRQDGRCTITNIKMTHNRNDLFAISIDRIERSVGHVKDNVQLVCQAVNLAKREYSNDDIFAFLKSAFNEFINAQMPSDLKINDFKYKLPTQYFSMPVKEKIMDDLRLQCKIFTPPSYTTEELQEDLKRIDELSIDDYLSNGVWRAHKPENKPFAGKRLIYHFHKHIWDVKSQNKPLIKEVWGHGPIFEKALKNLVNSPVRISFDRIIRELIFAGAGLPSQMHTGFAKAVLSHFAPNARIIYDPFAGWGSRLLACHSIGMHYIGCDLSPPTCDGLIRMASFINSDAKIINDDYINVTVDADVVFTSPPFGTEKYIGSNESIDINQLISKISHIPLKILHLPYMIGRKIACKQLIDVTARIKASEEISKECLVIL